MFKVVQIDESTIYVQGQGQVHPVPRSDVPFPVEIGQLLDIYSNPDGSLLVQPTVVTPQPTSTASAQDPVQEAYQSSSSAQDTNSKKLIFAGAGLLLLAIIGFVFLFNKPKTETGSSSIVVNRNSSASKKSSEKAKTSSSSKASSSSEEKTSSSSSAASIKEVRVSVKDLHIRATPSKSAASQGFINMGVHQITEEVSADGYTWGKLADGRGWIALEFTTPADSNSTMAPSTSSKASSSGMDVDAIVAGDYSSIAGTWRNGKGNTLVFDQKGLVDQGTIRGASKDGQTVSMGVRSGFTGYGITAVPAGEESEAFEKAGKESPGERNKDRLYAGHVLPSSSDEVYYRVD